MDDSLSGLTDDDFDGRATADGYHIYSGMGKGVETAVDALVLEDYAAGKVVDGELLALGSFNGEGTAGGKDADAVGKNGVDALEEFEGGGEGGVADKGDGADGFGDAVVPLCEAVAAQCGSCEGDFGTLGILAATGNGAHGFVGTEDGEGEDAEVFGKEGLVLGVGLHGDESHLVGIAITPLQEVVAVKGGGGEGDLLAVGVASTASNGAHGFVGRGGGDEEGVDGEAGGEGGVARYYQGTGVEGDTIGPHDEMVMFGSQGSKGGSSTKHIAAATSNGAHGGVGTECAYGVGESNIDGGPALGKVGTAE